MMQNTLQKSLICLTEQLEHKLSQADLLRVFHGETEAYGVEDAVHALVAAGFSAEFGTGNPTQLDPVLFPLICLNAQGAAFVVLSKIDAGAFRVVDFAEGPKEQIWQSGDARLEAASYVLRVSRNRQWQAGKTPENGHWFWGAFQGLRSVYFQIILAAAVANVLGLTSSLFTMVVYDRVLPNEAIDSLLALTFGVGFALGFDFLIKSLRIRFIDAAGKYADEKMAERLFNHLLALKMRARTGSNGQMASIMRDFEVVREFFTSASLTALVDFPFLALFVTVIYMIGGPLAIVPLVAVPVVLIAGLIVQPFLRKYAAEASSDGQTKQSILMETLSGMETLKTTGAEPVMRARWRAAVKNQSESGGKGRLLAQGTVNFTQLVQQVAQIGIVFYGVFLIRDGVVSMGALIACVILTGKTLAPLGQISQILTRLNQSIVAYRQIDQMMKLEGERKTGRRYLSRDRIEGHVAFQNVSFAYDPELGSVLNGLNLEIKPGEKVAIMGPVGSGKSTLARLILGLFEPDDGAVMLDGLDARAVDPADRTRNIGAVLQDCWLFSGTLRDNIVAGRFGVSDEEVAEKAKLSLAAAMAARHPHGFDMAVREGGMGVSGGQRQAIAIARSLIGDPPTLIMDEPTSSMDVQTEARVIENIKSWATDQRTLIVVTHRTSLLALVDRVIVLKDGKVSFDGNKNEMMARARRPENKEALANV